MVNSKRPKDAFKDDESIEIMLLSEKVLNEDWNNELDEQWNYV